MKNFKLFLLAIAIPFISFSQVKKVSLQAAGLTCSMCSNAINKAFKSMDYIDKVTTNLETNTFDITFKDASKVDFDQLKSKVEGAGFSVAKMVVTLDVNNLKVANDEHVIIGGKTFHFLDVKDQTLNGTENFTLVDKGFVLAKSFKKYASFTKMACINTGHMAACCAKDITAGTRIYHVTI